MTRVGAIAKGLGSLLVIVLTVVGTPLALVKIGAFPTAVPTPSGIWEGLSRPDLTGRGGVFIVLAILVWGCWGAFTLSLLREIPAAVRSHGQRAARPLPGLSWSARPAALLVAAIVAMFVAAPLLTAAAPVAVAGALPDATTGAGLGRGPVATAAQHPAAQHPAAHAAVMTTTGNHHPASSTATPSRAVAGAGPAQRYTVKRHDTLWSIAERQLGDPLRYTEIAALNPHLGSGHDIHVGDTLQLPTPPTTRTFAPTSIPAVEGTVDVTVEKGDTLSGIAAEHGVTNWRAKVWPANAGRAEPDGKHLTNPNHIEPGWHLTVPHSSGDASTRAQTVTDAAGSDHARPGSEPAAAAPVPAPPPAPVVHDPDATRLTPDPEKQVGQHVGQAPAPAAAGPPASPAQQPTPVVPEQPGASHAAPQTQVRPATQGRPVSGLAAGGLVAAAGVLSALVLLRRQQFRNRRPGRTIAAAGPDLIPFERAAVTDGGPFCGQVERLDELLRRAARLHDEGLPLAAVQLHDGNITLHLASPVLLPAPWTATEAAQQVWTFPADASAATAGPEPEAGDIGPFPTLVHLGSNTAGEWLLDLERAGGLILDGHPDRCLEVARVMAAQFALNTWSDMVSVTVVGFGQELAHAAPGRVRYADTAHMDAVMAAAGKEAEATADTMDRLDVDIVQARVQAACDELWAAQVILVAEPSQPANDTTYTSKTAADAASEATPNATADLGTAAAVTALLGTVDTRPNRTGTAVVVVAGRSDQGRPGLLAQVAADGTLTIASNGLVVQANRWDETTSKGVSLLLTHARTATDQPIPDAAGHQPWQAFSDQAGALREPLVLPRRTPNVHDSDLEPATTCTLPMADEVYLDAAATTTEDLDTLAPSVPVELRSQIADADPTLDADVAAWFDPASPTIKLSLLGPVTVHGPTLVPDQIAQSTDVIAYLATREHGATNSAIAEAFGVAETTARKYVAKARDLLGERPDGGGAYIPRAQDTPAGKARGIGVYEIGGLLVDADLFRRLRLRGNTRGTEGINDYATALRLVSGTPFSQMKGSRGAWLIQGDRIDFHLKHAIVDVAHVLATQALTNGDTQTARVAVDIARMASPDEETARLDNVAVTTAEGFTEQARRQLLDDVCNRSDDGMPPYDLSDRSRQILAHHRDWLSRAS